MDDTVHAQASSLFLQVVALPDEVRESFLKERCADHPLVMKEVLSLLQHDGHLSSEWAARLADDIREAVQKTPRDPEPGERLGPYKLVRVIGSGGMGIVYEADQEEPVRRRVAVKLIRAGLNSEDVLMRFAAEKQTLAVMNHDGIARVFDAGCLNSGRPFFIMEFVSGVPITTYCNDRNLSLLDRLNLFIEVCGAVEHAHQRGTIHRDLKPSNILVVETNGRAGPKVIDFGIAKIVEGPLGGESLHTRNGVLLGTPEYMSPEQADMATDRVNTTSDVYSLGVVLYELLTGCRPLDIPRIEEVGFENVARIIREREPLRPSQRLAVPSSRSTEIALPRPMSLHALIQSLRSDLDWIVMKCLSKEQERRYQSASELAADLRRFVIGDIVLARPPSLAYQMQRLLRRHRIATVSASLVLMAILAGLAAALWQGGIAARERATARDRLSELQRLASTLVAEFDHLGDLPGGTESKRILASMATTSLADLTSQSVTDPALRRSLAQSYESLGRLQGSPDVANIGDSRSALSNLRRAVNLRYELLQEQPDDRVLAADLMRSLYHLAVVLESFGRTPAVADTILKAIQIGESLESRGLLTPSDQKQLGILHGFLGWHYATSNPEKALAQQLRAIGMLERLLEEPSAPRDSLYRALADIHRGVCQVVSQPDEVLEHAGQSLDLFRKAIHENSLSRGAKISLSYGYRDYGNALRLKHRNREAMEQYRYCAEHREDLVRSDPSDQRARILLAEAWAAIGATFETLREPDSALAYSLRSVQILEHIIHKETAPIHIYWSLSFADAGLAHAYHDVGRDDLAEYFMRRAIWGRNWDPKSVSAAHHLNSWRLVEEAAHLLAEMGHRDEALRWHEVGATRLIVLARLWAANSSPSLAVRRDTMAGLIHTARVLGRSPCSVELADSLFSTATELARQETPTDSTFRHALLAIAQWRQDRGRFKEAERHYRRIVSDNPHDDVGRVAKACLHTLARDTRTQNLPERTSLSPDDIARENRLFGQMYQRNLARDPTWGFVPLPFVCSRVHGSTDDHETTRGRPYPDSVPSYSGPQLNVTYDPSCGSTPDHCDSHWSLVRHSPSCNPIVLDTLLVVSTPPPASNSPGYVDSLLSVPQPLTIEASLRIGSGFSTGWNSSWASISFVVSPKRGNILAFEEGGIFLLDPKIGRTETAAVNTQEFHRYQIAVTDSLITVSVDGVPRLRGIVFLSSDFAPGAMVGFGDESNVAYGASEWRYVAHNAP